MPKLLELTCFAAAAENGSLRKVAKALGMGEPSISRTIVKLGVSLLERSNTSVRLTNAGRCYLPEAKSAILQRVAAPALSEAPTLE
ncbi:LysR family transcriptional regulator [Roseibium porphyridii]|uniref:LysR family transcriptional regulator n=1 Tax=Roseibium porphyridii TaxID=2866279 RepID=UPI0025647621